jgi:protein-tyrosine phosphatase
MPDDGVMVDDRPVRVCFVCSGNICRSPIAEFVLRGLAERAGFDRLVDVDSAGTGDWHIGERADRRALQVLAEHGYDGSIHRARQFEPRWFASRDLVIALDRGHLRTLRSWATGEDERRRIHLLRSFDPLIGPDAPAGELDVPDPYYDDLRAFEEVLTLVESACAGLLDQVRNAPDGLVTRTG